MQPDGSGDWDLQHSSNVEMIVWKVSADLSESGGGILLDVAGALSGAALPSEFSVGMHNQVPRGRQEHGCGCGGG